MSGWIGVDLDGMLAVYRGWKGPGHIGDPVPAMVRRVKEWLAQGQEVRIFTARVAASGKTSDEGVVDGVNFADEQRRLIQDWCEEHLGVRLEVTATKDFDQGGLYWICPACGLVFRAARSSEAESPEFVLDESTSAYLPQARRGMLVRHQRRLL